MHRFQHRRTHLALASLALLAACGKGETPKADSTAATPRTLVAGASARAAAMPGALTKPIDQYTADEFDAFVKTLSYVGGHERDRKCKDDPACDGTKPTKKTKVLVDAVASQDSLAGSNAPQFGVVYIRALNKGALPEARYGFLPGTHNEYYVIVASDGSGGLAWTLEQLDTKARRISAVGSGKFNGCNHAWVAGPRADFKTCANAAAARDSVVRLGLALQITDDDPMWAACSQGCCIVDH